MKTAISTIVKHALIAITILAFTPDCVRAQFPIPTPDFSCKPRIILDWVNGAIPACTDTIVIPTDAPPERDPSSSVVRGASLHRLTWSGGELVVGEEIQCKVIDGPPALHVALVLEHHLPTHEPDGSPINYQVNLYCGYWSDKTSDTTSIRFTMYGRYYALAEARLLSDSSLLQSDLLVSPSSTPLNGFSILSPMIITAREGLNDVVFDHWSSDNETLAFDRYGREQMLSGACWPTSDTVVFTAWYRGTPTSGVESTQTFASGLKRELSVSEMADVVLFDLQGRQVDVRQPGIYLAVVNTADGVRWVQPLLIMQ